MSYHCEILADSFNPDAHRLTTFLVTFPRMVLADMTRHRMLSYSFESTRAVPIEARIEQVRTNPFVPRFRERVKGMAMGEFLEGEALMEAEHGWRAAGRAAAAWADELLDVEKGLAGRLLEPFLYITGIVSGTEWENFFNLRCHPAAQYELQVIAEMMRDAMDESDPKHLGYGGWHLPLVTTRERDTIEHDTLAEASAGRCAAISYLKHSVDEPAETSVNRWATKLAPSAHWSPGEHPAQATRTHQIGNFKGFKQLRKFYPSEAVAKDPQ